MDNNLNGTSTYIEFDDATGEVALHLPHDQDEGELMNLAAMLFFALRCEECQDLLSEIERVVSESIGEDI